MIQEVIDGVIAAIRTEYDVAQYKIYTETVEQDIKQPCFFVMCLSPHSQKQTAVRSRRYYLVEVTYFPQSEETPVQECAQVYEELVDCLTDISVEKVVVHGDEISGNVVDGLLHFQITYDLFLLKREETEAMEECTEQSSIW